jgi:hypothetical protein
VNRFALPVLMGLALFLIAWRQYLDVSPSVAAAPFVDTEVNQ